MISSCWNSPPEQWWSIWIIRSRAWLRRWGHDSRSISVQHSVLSHPAHCRVRRECNTCRLNTDSSPMMNKMVVANLVHRPTRSFIATSAIALEVVMILMVVALFYGLLNGSKESQLGVGADLMVMPPGASSVIGLSGAPIPIKVGDKLRRVPHVASAVPAVWWFTSKPIEIIYGIDV